LHVRLHMLCVHKVISQKIDLSFGLRKKTNFGAKNKIFYSTYFVFLQGPRAMSFFHETTHMNYGDVHVKFFI
jgi:hypothetical protein